MPRRPHNTRRATRGRQQQTHRERLRLELHRQQQTNEALGVIAGDQQRLLQQRGRIVQRLQEILRNKNRALAQHRNRSLARRVRWRLRSAMRQRHRSRR